MKNWNYTQINYQSNQKNYCSKAMRQRKHFWTKNKNNLDIDSYVRCLMQQNCKSLKVMLILYIYIMYKKTYIITSVETYINKES